MDISPQDLWILEHATAYQGEAKLMRCEHEATLDKPTKDMLMGSMGVVRLILSKSTVANLRHQSIINMNETKKIGNYMTRSYNTMELNFFYAIKICCWIIFSIIRWNFKFNLSKRIITRMAWHVVATTTTVLLQLCDRSVQCIESCHDGIECGLS
jgi:hypothetical protein